MSPAGVGIMLRKLGSTSKPTVEFSVNDGVWTFKTISTLKTTEIKFRLGEEVTETTLDGRECKVCGGDGGSGARAACWVKTLYMLFVCGRASQPRLMPCPSHRRYSRRRTTN